MLVIPAVYAVLQQMYIALDVLLLIVLTLARNQIGTSIKMNVLLLLLRVVQTLIVKIQPSQYVCQTAIVNGVILLIRIDYVLLDIIVNPMDLALNLLTLHLPRMNVL